MTSTPTPETNVSFDEACRFLTKFGKAAHGYGSTAPNLEASLSNITEALGFRGAFQITPTEIIFCISGG